MTQHTIWFEETHSSNCGVKQLNAHESLVVCMVKQARGTTEGMRRGLSCAVVALQSIMLATASWCADFAAACCKSDKYTGN